MGVIAKLADGLQNLVSGLGTPRDKAASAFYVAPTLTDEQLVSAYRSSWVARKIIDIPALDSCRRWRSWQAEESQIELIEAEEARLAVKSKILDARIKARLFGGAAVLIGTGDVNPAEPLDVERVAKGGVAYLTVLTKRQITAGELETDPMSPLYGRPKVYSVKSAQGGQVDIHPSRLVIFTGAALPDEITGVSQGWGDSVLVSAMEAIRQADGTAANIASLVYEAKVDVIRVPDFMNNLADPNYENTWLRRFTLAATGKGINGTLVLDREEEYEQKSASFATLPDILDRFVQNVAGAADIPTTRLLGQSPAGMSSTGESDLRNYYDRISAGQELEMQPAMSALDECLIRSALGARPPEVHYIWSSLWQISDRERAEIGKMSAETLKTLNDTALWPQEALATAGANMLVEHSILPGLQEAIEEAGGLPDYEAEMEARPPRAAETQRGAAEAEASFR